MRDTKDLNREPFLADILFEKTGAIYTNPKEAFPEKKEQKSEENDNDCTSFSF